jgi:hypothetical protein
LILGQIDGLVGCNGLVEELHGRAQGLSQATALVTGAEMRFDGFVAVVSRGKGPAGEDLEDLVTAKQ